jgi:hypothetical protein
MTLEGSEPANESTVKPVCFVIAPLDREGSEIRKRSDQILKHILEPAIETCGYVALRADKISKAGLITSQIIDQLVNAPIVIADLTDHNPNVFYELAIRHAVRKPYVQMIHKTQTIPFDLLNIRTIHFDHQDLDSAESARKALTLAIKEVEGKLDIESPLSVAIDIERLRNSNDPAKRQIADLTKGINDLKRMIVLVTNQLNVMGMQNSMAGMYGSNRNAFGGAFDLSGTSFAGPGYSPYRGAGPGRADVTPAGNPFEDEKEE